MVLNTTFFIVAIAVILIWVVIEVKRLKHKLMAIFLIGLVIFTYVTFTVSLRNQDVDLKTLPGVIKAGRLYWSWLGTLFTNTKSITAYASKQDWKKVESVNVTTTKIEEKIDEANDIWSKL